MNSPTRRRFLGQAVTASGLLLPWGRAAASGPTRLPRVALVIGNASYEHVAPLRNPRNDATAVAKALAASGFKVDTAIDADRDRMAKALAAYEAALAAGRGVGVFYYAGHGFQLAWRNYLLPVTAKVASADQVPAQCVDVSSVLAGLRRAGNAMNLVILDACRNDPFEGSGVRLEQKGLSQIDAPPGTLLAYATAPGHEASDGHGANGLYTEHLLREMVVPDARVEDVFKRVRLGVRRASKGAQVPWESTSLEDDFSFNDTESSRQASREEAERRFQEERRHYEAAREADSVDALAEYLARYPSGHFCELAQLQLDRALAREGEKPVAPVSAAGNPLTVGTARADTEHRVGDRYAYRDVDRISGNTTHVILRVTEVTGDRVIFNNGRVVWDRLGNQVRDGQGREYTPRQDIPLEYAVGKRWTTRFEFVAGGDGPAEIEFRIVAREKIAVPAGTFDCFRIEGRGFNQQIFRPSHEHRFTIWRAPAQVRALIAYEGERFQGGNRIESRRRELTSFLSR